MTIDELVQKKLGQLEYHRLMLLAANEQLKAENEQMKAQLNGMQKDKVDD